MSTTVSPDRVVAVWQPPMDGDALGTVLEKLRAWQPFDGDAWLDDVADALDEVAPSEDATDELVQRLRRYLMQLVSIAISAKAEQWDRRALKRIERARTARAEEMPADNGQARALVRRMGWAVNELLDLLVELGAVERPASL
ncbi:DUF6415 family natural product biosynthesis protein [Streptomyces sp. NPDC003011]